MEAQAIETLALYFVDQIAYEKAQIHREDMLKKAIKEIPLLLSEGWTYETLTAAIYKNACDFPLIAKHSYHIRDAIGNMQAPFNILEADAFYYHNELREDTHIGPKRVVGNKLVEIQASPFQLIIKRYYGIENFLDYYYKRIKQEQSSKFKRRDESRVKHLIENYDVDVLLFAIDCMVDSRQVAGLKITDNLFRLQDYIQEAEEALSRKRNHHRLLGINKEA